MNHDEDTYTFVVEWYDSVADLSRKYNLTYWPKDGSLSMYDLAKNRLFLKRVANNDINFPNDLYVGKTILVYSRQLKIIDYADLFTKNKFESISKLYHTLFINFKSFTQFLATINKYEAPFHFKTINSIVCNHQIQQILQIENANEILILCEFAGTKDIESAFNQCSKDDNFNGIMCDKNKHNKLIEEINTCPTSAILSSENEISSLCLIKPHALLSTSSIINDILSEGFNITAITTKKLTLSEAKDFYEIYNGVVKEYNYLIEQLLSGPVIALQIQCSNNKQYSDNKEEKEEKNNLSQVNKCSAFIEFREFVGPSDPEIAKVIRPNSLRAKYGIDRIKNAIHCTDLEDDGKLESNFFFQLTN
eukprot:458115_1